MSRHQCNNPNQVILSSNENLFEDSKKSKFTKDTELMNLSENGKSERPELKRLLTHDLEEKFKNAPLTEDTTCGWGFVKSSFLQKFANKKAYVVIYGLAGCILSATFAYHNSTITTLEKRYKIPSKTIGIIGVGNDISSVLLSGAISYYAGKGHRPRWAALGCLIFALYCFMTSLPHFLYGSGEEALSLTVEYGGSVDSSITAGLMEQEKRKSLCQTNNDTLTECEEFEASFAPIAILFFAQLLCGMGWILLYTLGTIYLDDNCPKAETPALISVSFFLRTLGPALGYAFGSLCLKQYIAINYTPTITNKDPRWLGAWWTGWLAFGGASLLFAGFISLFPKELPEAAVRRMIQEEKKKLGEVVEDTKKDNEEDKATFSDMIVTFKRLLKNKPYMINNFSSIFYFFGYLPYWIYTPKYIETQYKQSASTASFVTGTVALGFSAIGILASGLIISKYKPSARYLAAWNVFVGALSVVGIIWYISLGCAANENSLVVNQPLPGEITCNSDCHCDFIKYSPVCGEDGKTYISPCHAGCVGYTDKNDSMVYTDCSCIAPGNNSENLDSFIKSLGTAVPSACQIDCQSEFYIFLVVMCIMKFSGATGRASNFLVSVRCVEEKDKSASIGLGSTMMCLLAFVPSPIFFGALFDSTCILWGKTCSGTGNCWLYDNERLRVNLNLISAIFVLIGTLFDAGVWFYVKNLKIFDDEDHDSKDTQDEK